MSKWGSASAWFLCDGYDMLANKLQGLRYKTEAITEPTHGIGDSWEEHTPAGVSRAEFAQEGAFFDSSTSGGLLHQMFSGTVIGTTSANNIICVGFNGMTSGEEFVGFEGAYRTEYEVLGQRGNLTRANATFVIDGSAENGTILRASDTSSTATFYLDGETQTTGGGASYLHVTSLAVTGDTGGITINVYHASVTSGSYTLLSSFDQVTDIGGWRSAATDDTIEQFLLVSVSSTGTISDLKAFVGVTRK